MAGRDTNIGAGRARETREQLGLAAGEPLTCVLTVVEGPLALPVVIASLPTGVAGCCWRDGARVVLWVNGTHAAVRQRFTIAHELGHVRCRHDGAVPVETFATLGGKSTDSREVQANAFAAEFLAPADGVQTMVGGEPTLDHVVLISARFGISTIAALYRLNSLGLTKCYEELKAAIANGDPRGGLGPAGARVSQGPHRGDGSGCAAASVAIARGFGARRGYSRLGVDRRCGARGWV